MSLSWRSRIYITISPGSISVLRLGRGNVQPLASHEEPIDLSSGATLAHAVLEKLGEVCGRPEFRAAEADVILSNRLVRHAIIPIKDELKKYTEREAFARHVLAKTYGAAAAQRELRLQRQAGGGNWLVAAVDRALLDGIRQACAAQKVRLRSVSSRLVEVVRSNGKPIQAAPAWMVIHEPGYSQFALLNDKQIVALSGVKHTTLEELPVLLDRENLASGLAEPCRVVYLDTKDGAAELLGGRYEVSRIETNRSSKWSAFAAALPLSRKKAGEGMRLNFQEAGERPNRNAGWALLAAGLVLVLEMGVSYNRLQNDRAAMNHEIVASKLRLDEDDGKGRAQFTQKDLDAAREIVSRLSTPWEAFFTGLESVSSAHVAILSIAPDMQTGVLRIAGEARDYASLLTLVAQLRSTKPFSEVYLASHEIKRDDPEHPVKFVVSMHWASPQT